MSSSGSAKLVEISKVIADKGDGISYISNEEDNYIIGTRRYDERIAKYLDKTVKSWKGKESDLVNLKKKKGKAPQTKKVAYLWKIPLNEDNFL
jgi:hypothetical protein